MSDQFKYIFTNRSVTRIATKKRGPPRYLGFTKAQILDEFMRTNARIWATVTFGSLPLFAWMLHNYRKNVKPEQERILREREEALLSEGKYKG